MAGPAAAPVETQYIALVWRRKILRLYVDAMGHAGCCVVLETQDIASLPAF